MTELDPTLNDPIRARLGSLPAVGRVVDHPRVRLAAAQIGHPILLRLIREMVDHERERLATPGEAAVDFDGFCAGVAQEVARLSQPSLRSVINATGIIIHTNLGRAPLSRPAAEQVARLAEGYSNLELELETGKRGSRQTHVRRLLCALTGAEDVLVVNNNAAAILLVSRGLAWRSQIIVSRGELVEIGESFRLPDIMRAGEARLVEVGSTNRTCLADYESAIGPRTALLFKAHTSNFKAIGFTAQVPIETLAACAHAHRLPCVYDLGSGLLRRPAGLDLADEPSAQEALSAGADLVTFSGDKLLGGGQAGVLAGRRELIAKLSRSPILRALRPGRLALAALEAVALQHLDEQRLLVENPVFRMLGRTTVDLRAQADKLTGMLALRGVAGEVVASNGQVGGGALPGLTLPGWAVRLLPSTGAAAGSARTSTKIFLALLRGRPAVLSVLREGAVVLDVRTIAADEMDGVADAVTAAVEHRPRR